MRLHKNLCGDTAGRKRVGAPSSREEQSRHLCCPFALAAKNADVFVGHGLSKSFLEQFRAATSALSDALGARVECQRRRTVANKSVAELVKKGDTAVQMLDAVVTSRLAHDPDLLAAWRSVKRLTQSGGSAGVVRSPSRRRRRRSSLRPHLRLR